MIEATDVSKRLGHRDTSFAIQGVSFRVDRGSVFGILGADRSGKTTLIRMLATLLEPTSGTVAVDGIDTQLDRERARSLLGYQPQAPAIDRNVSVADYLNFWGGVDGMSATARRERIRALFDFLGLGGQGDQPILDSTIEVQRKAYLALAMLHDPPILLLDEPTAGLAPPERAAFLMKLHELRNHGKTIVLTSGKLAFLDSVCDHMIVIAEGRATKHRDTSSILRIVSEGRHARSFLVANVPPEQVAPQLRDVPGVLDMKIADPAIVFFVDPRTFRLDEVRRRVEGSGFEVRTLREAEITIGDVFRTLFQKERQ